MVQGEEGSYLLLQQPATSSRDSRAQKKKNERNRTSGRQSWGKSTELKKSRQNPIQGFKRQGFNMSAVRMNRNSQIREGSGEKAQGWAEPSLKGSPALREACSRGPAGAACWVSGPSL